MDLFDILLIVAHLLIFIVFVNRYIFGEFFLHLNAKALSETIEEFEPSVTFIIPMYNEGSNIKNAIKSISQLKYPKDKLHTIIIDDCSQDNSFKIATEEAKKFPNIQVFKNKKNIGKRKSLIWAVKKCPTEFVISMDSDVTLDKDVIFHLMRCFIRPDIAAVGGKINVANININWLTQMQTVKYFYSYECLKNIERAFFTVMCLSGCLTAYRKKVLIELEELLANRNVFGIPIKYGEDRFLTRHIIKAGYKTTLTLYANAYTKVPENLNKYFSQQLRWRRSNIIDYFCGLSHIWKVHPIVGVHYLGLFAMLMSYSMIIFQTIVSSYFFELMMYHLLILFGFSLFYQIKTWKYPKNKKASFPLSFLTIAIIMPVTYLILTPIALFTLDSGSWETR